MYCQIQKGRVAKSYSRKYDKIVFVRKTLLTQKIPIHSILFSLDSGTCLLSDVFGEVHVPVLDKSMCLRDLTFFSSC